MHNSENDLVLGRGSFSHKDIRAESPFFEQLIAITNNFLNKTYKRIVQNGKYTIHFIMIY